MTGQNIPKHYSLPMIPHGLDALRSLAQFDYLLADQVAKRWFVGEPLDDTRIRAEAAAYDVCKRKCLKRLKDNGWIERVMVFHDHPVSGHTFRDGVYVLTAGGRRVLSEMGHRVRPRRGLTDRIYNQKVDHKLAIRDAALALQSACQQHGWTFSHWLDDGDIRAAQRRHATRLVNQPDGFCVVTVGRRRCPLFFEIDRKHEVPLSAASREKSWELKVERYGAYLRDAYLHDPLWRGLGLEVATMERPLVLTITEDEEHVARLLRATRAAGGRGSYWYTSWPRLAASPLAILEANWRVTISDQRRRLWDHLVGREATVQVESPPRFPTFAS